MGQFEKLHTKMPQNMQKTLSLLKPDAVRRSLTGAINKKFEERGLSIIAQKMLTLTREQAARFYIAHKERPFFNELCKIMSSGPIVAQVLQGKEAIRLNREIMGDTNPDNAAEGTIRRDFARSIDENTVHGSDSEQAAREEIAFFFAEMDIA